MSEGDATRFSLADTPIPSHQPAIPEELVHASLQALSGVTKAVFRPWIGERITLIWLENEERRLGMTRFEVGPNELARRRTLRIDPGEVTIGLHPALIEDTLLYNHTFVHEFLHAAGLMSHSTLHDELTQSIAPSPSMKESPLLQRMRSSVLGEASVQQWSCKLCGYAWKRTTVRRPMRCLKCARPL
tara:strand:- start:3677 stop:4237 length:561 start_codon:yes stop_codon:yes gene_type:complete